MKFSSGYNPNAPPPPPEAESEADRALRHRQERQRRKEAREGAVGALGTANQVGISSALCLLAGLWIGLRLDRWLGTSPCLLMLGALLGAASAFKVLYDTVIKKWMS